MLREYFVLLHALAALGRYASMVRRGVSCQCKERCYYVCPFRPGDTAGDRYKQSPAPAQAASRHTGDGQFDESLSA